MWTVILNALVKQLTEHPDQVFTLIEKIVDLFQQHPEAVQALLKQLPPPKSGGQ